MTLVTCGWVRGLQISALMVGWGGQDCIPGARGLALAGVVAVQFLHQWCFMGLQPSQTQWPAVVGAAVALSCAALPPPPPWWQCGVVPLHPTVSIYVLPMSSDISHVKYVRIWILVGINLHLSQGSSQWSLRGIAGNTDMMESNLKLDITN